MTSSPPQKKLLKGSVVLIHPMTSAVRCIIALQYNPDSISRNLQMQSVDSESGDRSEALQLKCPPVETIKVEAEIDAIDQRYLEQAGIRNGGALHNLVEGVALPRLSTIGIQLSGDNKPQRNLANKSHNRCILE